MPLVEVLTTSSSHAPGWAYVPDTNFDPSQAAIKPTTGRKRGIREPGGRTDLTSRQTTAIIRHLAELDRENHRDAQIPIPTKKDAPKDAAGRVSRGKTTPNVRRILQSQKTFRNYLDDEEAALAQAQNVATATSQRLGVSRVTKISSSVSSRRSLTPVIPKPEQSRRRQQQQRRKSLPPPPSAAAASTPTTPGPSVEKEKEKEQEPGPGPEQEQEKEEPHVKGLIKSEYDNDPLLRSYIPSAPSERIMQALLAEPPLTYNASRAGPPASGKPPRFFCTICGYWGKIRCRSCGVRTCGLDCYKVHEDSRCGAFF